MSRADLDRLGHRRDRRQAQPGREFSLGRRTALGEARLLRMLDDDAAEPARIGEGEAHEPCRPDSPAAIGEAHRPGFQQKAQLRQLLACAAACDGAIGQDGQAAGFLAARPQQPYQRRVIDRR